MNEEQDGGASMESMDALLVDFLAQSERQAFENGRAGGREKEHGGAAPGARPPRILRRRRLTPTRE